MKIMNKLLIWITMLAVLPFSVCAEDEHKHIFRLSRNENGDYMCLCTIVDCETNLTVYALSNVAAVQQGDVEDCSHVFSRNSEIIRQNVESLSAWWHGDVSWYDCTCRMCGLSFEAYEIEGKVYEHTYSGWKNMHLNGTFKHLYWSQCDACGKEYNFIATCYQFEDGNCMMDAENYSLK